MALFDPMLDRLKMLNRLRPSELKRLSNEKLTDLIEAEWARSKPRVDELVRTYPSAGSHELAQRLIDQKKQLASVVGGVTGVFGAVTVPVDLLGMAYLELSLLVDIATVYKVNLRSEGSKQEIADQFAYSNGIAPTTRAGPRVLGSLASMALKRGGLSMLGRAMPLVAAPVSAYLNNQHIQKVGESALRHYEGWAKAHEKAKKDGSA